MYSSIHVLIISYIIKNSPRPLVVRRWWLCLPWIILYGLNIIGLFASGIVAFYQLTNNLKLVGLLPLAYGQFRHFTPRSYDPFCRLFPVSLLHPSRVLCSGAETQTVWDCCQASALHIQLG